jgi:hypothetical protein
VARTVRDKGIVCLQVNNIDLVNASGDVAMDMMCPGDNAFVLDWTVQISTAGDATENHELTLEHGTTTDGVALTAQLDVVADATAGTVYTGDGLGRPSTGGTVMGTKIQIKNVEGGAIGNGAIVDVLVRWQL